jgi:hypothetical protein
MNLFYCMAHPAKLQRAGRAAYRRQAFCSSPQPSRVFRANTANPLRKDQSV